MTNKWRAWLLLAAWLAAVPSLSAEELFEASFFASCHRGPKIHVHQDANPLDPHTLLYTTANLMELEVVRLIDWLIDVPLPGREVRPLERAIAGIRSAYHRLGTHRVLERTGEFVDALQLRELSLGDTAAAYTVSTGGSLSPGSGTIVRVMKLVDWVQHVTGDVNELGGRLVGRPRGLIRWRLPGRVVDGVQWLVVKLTHDLSVVVARGADYGVTGVEGAAEVLLNAPAGEPHRETTVVLRMPPGVYRAYEVWVVRHRSTIYVGTPEELAGLTHADLFHRRGKHPSWWDVERLAPEPTAVIVVMDARTFASAPESWTPYVIPIAWVRTPPR